jgi:hypothetical protein
MELYIFGPVRKKLVRHNFSGGAKSYQGLAEVRLKENGRRHYKLHHDAHNLVQATHY